MRDAAETRATLRAIFDAAVRAAHPSDCLPAFLPEPPAKGQIIVLAAGKAAASMTVAAERFYLDERGVAPARLAGLAVTRIGYGEPTRVVGVVEAGHPVPDEAGLAAARSTLALAQAAGEDDLVLALISGGGSANWIAPAGGLTLAEKQGLTRALLRSGASIGEINTLRKRLSLIKGGRLARIAAPARIVTLAISDVPGDDPSTIASGPTVPDHTTMADARAVAAKYRLDLPPAAKALLADDANETPKPGDPAFARAEFAIVATPAQSLAAAAEAAKAAGYEPLLLGADLEGEARDVARAHAKEALRLKAAGQKAALISGGELTVTIKGEGRGGPNQEYALALALALDGESGIAALAGDTDGTDGGAGKADDPAGAVVDATTLRRARDAGLDAQACLANNDSTGFFETIGDLLQPGPTRTNVNDLRVVLIG
ncbi:hydroxypyruvate reductase [Alsobacter metallidurans]|uniref:Hydroxypyruvate reductase n=1 Tax=Alsobacter metallidurans TaxID=340221 RepID=A0A917IBL6_9HYPH|nr:glycerate kinase [Alsobacter metallidurans]GGH30168.1 hydroxypyruvate reductase [Alsobacter metallidurans]